MHPAPSLVEDATAIQRAYPRIYLACHRRHRRATTSAEGISDRDAALLGHLDRVAPLTASQLGRHLGIGLPSLSATVERLVQGGFIDRTRDPRDRRRSALRLTAQGEAAMRANSVLDEGRLVALLRRLRPEQRRLAVQGLRLLADAAGPGARS